MSCPNSERSGAPLKVPAIFFTSTSTHDGKPTFSASCSASWMRSWPLAFSVTPTTSRGLDERRGHVEDLAVDGDRAVRDELAGLGARRSEPHPVDDIVEPRLEELQQVRARRALAPGGLAEVPAELPLENAVRAAQLLLLAELVAVVRHPHARAHAVLAGLRVELALGVERTPRALEEEVGAFPPRELAFGSGVSSHVSSSYQFKSSRSTALFTSTELSRSKCGGASAAGSRCAESASRPRCW